MGEPLKSLWRKQVNGSWDRMSCRGRRLQTGGDWEYNQSHGAGAQAVTERERINWRIICEVKRTHRWWMRCGGWGRENRCLINIYGRKMVWFFFFQWCISSPHIRNPLFSPAQVAKALHLPRPQVSVLNLCSKFWVWNLREGNDIYKKAPWSLKRSQKC